MFDYTGGIDTQSTLKAINSIKALGVKEYLAKQEAEKTKANASVPTGNTVVQQQGTTMPSREEIINTPGLYTKLAKQYGMDKVDAVIAKG